MSDMFAFSPEGQDDVVRFVSALGAARRRLETPSDAKAGARFIISRGLIPESWGAVDDETPYAVVVVLAFACAEVTVRPLGEFGQRITDAAPSLVAGMRRGALATFRDGPACGCQEPHGVVEPLGYCQGCGWLLDPVGVPTPAEYERAIAVARNLKVGQG